jgi:hypothetical protein
MYAKDRTTLIDRREMLKIKLKSLAEEARIIRHEERKTHGYLREQLHLHRTGIVRRAARNTQLAYAFIRGRSLVQVEPTAQTEPDWTAIEKMISTYGSKDFDPKQLQQWRKGWEEQKAA